MYTGEEGIGDGKGGKGGKEENLTYPQRFVWPRPW